MVAAVDAGVADVVTPSRTVATGPRLRVDDRVACAVRSDGTWCWGQQLNGISSGGGWLHPYDTIVPPTRVSDLHGVLQRDGQRLCVVDDNAHWQCGLPWEANNIETRPGVALVSRRTFSNSTSAHRVGDGEHYECALDELQLPRCSVRGNAPIGDFPDVWGLVHTRKALDLWTRNEQRVRSLGRVREVAISNDLACALLDQGNARDVQMRCFDERGAFDPDFLAEEITASHYQLCARSSDGAVRCAGRPGYGRLDGHMCNSDTGPNEIPGGPFREVHASSSCAITATRPSTAVCWGSMWQRDEADWVPIWPPRVVPLAAEPRRFARNAWVETVRGESQMLVSRGDQIEGLPSTVAGTAESFAGGPIYRCTRQGRLISCDSASLYIEESPDVPQYRFRHVTRRASGEVTQLSLHDVDWLCAKLADQRHECWSLTSRRHFFIPSSTQVAFGGFRAVCRRDATGAVACSDLLALASRGARAWREVAGPAARDVAVGAYDVCVVGTDGHVSCGEITRAGMRIALHPTALRNAVDVEVHHGTTCAIDAAGALRCIGASRYCDSGAPAQWSARTFYPMRWE